MVVVSSAPDSTLLLKVVSVVTVLAHGLLIFTVVVLALLIAGKLVVTLPRVRVRIRVRVRGHEELIDGALIDGVLCQPQ